MGRKDVCADISAPLSYFVFKNKLLIASDRVTCTYFDS